MRRLLVWTVTAGILLLAGGRQAIAKEGHEDPRSGATGVLSPVPRDLEPGKAWNARITFLKDGRVLDAEGFRPTVTLTNLRDGRTIGVPALSAGPGVYTARVVFPQAGRWTIAVRNGFDGRITDLTTLTVSAAAPALSGARSFPVWAWLASALLSLLVVTGVFLVVPRIRRKQAAVFP
jgi:hypothetical protein